MSKIRTYMEIICGAALLGLLVWQLLTAATLRAKLADQKTLTLTAQLRYQAAQASEASCSAALGQIQVATSALTQATRSAYAANELALQRASGRDLVTRQAITAIRSVRAEPDKDCETATGLARAAWEEGQ